VLIPILLLALSPLATAKDYPLPPPPSVSTATGLNFWADHADYDGPSATLHLKGHVRVQDSTGTIKADELWLDTRERCWRGSRAPGRRRC
jgi:lipopolysaccharide assembly outer membrane protein LptD (OstA)